MRRFIAIGFVVVFITGWLCSNAYSVLSSSKHTSVERDLALPIAKINTPIVENDTAKEKAIKTLSTFLQREAEELPSPYDHIKEHQIKVFPNKVIIELKNAEWATFTDTNSMDPVIDYGANAIEIVPKSPEDIHVGDIVSYESKFARGTIIHRVVEIGYDDKGWYCRMKGDNLSTVDPGKIRFEQIRRIVVGILH